MIRATHIVKYLIVVWIVNSQQYVWILNCKASLLLFQFILSTGSPFNNLKNSPLGHYMYKCA